ncbi:MAG: multicopper oxidase domain-containing protein [Anaerolineae bacterium]|nr:multicopper oxidase domain-containing protein [Anaerolineae bacterium]
MTYERRKDSPRISRRDFLRFAGAGLGALAVGSIASGLSGCTVPALGRRTSASAEEDSGPFEPDTEINLRAVRDEVAILPGAPTKVWRFVADVVRGAESTVRPLPNAYLGPILSFTRGERVRINFTNRLEEPTIVHWHGLHIPEAADGHPRLAIDPGESYVYEFTVLDRAGTYWYHPHPHGRTGPQVYNGLAGLVLVADPESSPAGLPTGDYDIPLVIQDRTFTSDNQLAYLDRQMPGRMMGFLGDRVLVNGQPDFELPVKARPYRLRILNGSNARIYKLAWQDGRALTVIGTDGGLLGRATVRPYVTLSPGERVELWADFGDDAVGSQLTLESQRFPGSQAFPVMKVVVEEATEEGEPLPEQLSDIVWHAASDAVNRRHPRTFDMDMRQMTWLLNGRTFEMNDVAKNEVVRLGDLEVWEFVNESPRMAMAHPMHVHNVQFQVIERQVLAAYADQHATLAEGFVDTGWKDTVLVMPGERVKVLLKFEHYVGLYLYHCHNLEHEDMGMMRNYRIRA